jgi:HNH endonuclease/WYL domain
MKCILCSEAATQGISLANGGILHSPCFQRLTSEYSEAEILARSAQMQVLSARSDISSRSGFFQKLSYFFSGGISLDQLEFRAKQLKEKADIAERAYSIIRVKAVPIFDVLLDYPPDWESRREEVRTRDVSCLNCGSSQNLQAHHVIPLSRGGTNRSENLKLLCEKCHKSEHGGRDFSNINSKKTLAFAERIQVIESAISAKQDIEFLYQKPTDSTKTKRRVTPHELIEMDHEHDDGRTLCLQGYCHSRKANRVFALKRMMGVKHA